ncbi:MAG TPA: FemAB family XrtA/PEP-CTERM system-associated protein [bacterium]
MEVRAAVADDAERWDCYVDGSPAAAAYHRFGWKGVVERSFGHRTHYLLAESGGGVAGVLPLVRLKSRLFGNFLVSMPFVTYGGVCADDQEARVALLREAVNIARRENASHIELRHREPLDLGLPAKTAKVSMHLGLPDSADHLLKSFDAKLRSQIRRPAKDGMTVRSGRADELDAFYDVFAANMRDLGTPVYAKDFFRNILEEFPDSTWIRTVYTRDGEPAASGFLLGFKDTLEIPWASSVRRFNRSSPNTLLYWSVLAFACEQGYATFDFGRSTPGEGTYRFKEQWGARPVQLYWHYWLDGGGALPEINPRNPKYRAAIACWKRLPVGLTTLLGPRIVKNLP